VIFAHVPCCPDSLPKFFAHSPWNDALWSSRKRAARTSCNVHLPRQANHAPSACMASAGSAGKKGRSCRSGGRQQRWHAVVFRGEPRPARAPC